jgi:hypothetical protein
MKLLERLKKLFAAVNPIPPPINRKDRRTRFAIARKQAALRKRKQEHDDAE